MPMLRIFVRGIIKNKGRRRRIEGVRSLSFLRRLRELNPFRKDEVVELPLEEMNLSPKEMEQVRVMAFEEGLERDPLKESAAIHRSIQLVYRRRHRRIKYFVVCTILLAGFLTPMVQEYVRDFLIYIHGYHPGTIESPKTPVNLKQNDAKKDPQDTPLSYLYFRCLPTRSLSALWLYVSAIYIPEVLRSPIFRLWSFTVGGTDIKDLELPLVQYPTLFHFFIRKLRPGARNISTNPMVSPCDGIIAARGHVDMCDGGFLENLEPKLNKAENSSSKLPILKVKQYRCSISTLLGYENIEEFFGRHFIEEKKQQKKCLYYCVLRLPIGSYHHFHAPSNIQVMQRKHIPGYLHPTSPKLNPAAVCTNERLILSGKWNQGFFALAAIGGLGRGSIRLSIEPEIETNLVGQSVGKITEHPYRYTTSGYDTSYLPPKLLQKGEDLGHFRFGSCVVLVFEGEEGLRWSQENGQRVAMGEALVAAAIDGEE